MDLSRLALQLLLFSKFGILAHVCHRILDPVLLCVHSEESGLLEEDGHDDHCRLGFRVVVWIVVSHHFWTLDANLAKVSIVLCVVLCSRVVAHEQFGVLHVGHLCAKDCE